MIESLIFSEASYTFLTFIKSRVPLIANIFYRLNFINTFYDDDLIIKLYESRLITMTDLCKYIEKINNEYNIIAFLQKFNIVKLSSNIYILK